jgi:short-subunit dehydrogenase
VWFGIAFHGGWAKLLAIPHWAVYAALTYGFWRMRPWMFPWAAVYFAQVAFGMLVWPILHVGGVGGWLAGLVSGGALAVLTHALWRARPLFEAERGSLRERYGEWALVTGASSGIGAELARALARDGIHCVLAARRGDRLRELAAELEKDHGVEARVVEADLSEEAGWRRLLDAVADLPIAILCNNAGFGAAGRFDKLDGGRLDRMVRLHCGAPVALTHALLPGMLERGRGAVIVTGSVAGRQPLPLHAVYGATKAFDQQLGEALWGELRGTGVDVLVLEPATTTTEFHDVAGELPHPGKPAWEVVSDGLDALGRQPSVIPGWFYWLRANAAMRLLPRSVAALVAKQYMHERTSEPLR